MDLLLMVELGRLPDDHLDVKHVTGLLKLGLLWVLQKLDVQLCTVVLVLIEFIWQVLDDVGQVNLVSLVDGLYAELRKEVRGKVKNLFLVVH